MKADAAEKRAREHFERVTADHKMSILHDDGLYRHLRFQTPATWNYGYDIVTWPGHLALNGDLDSGYVFSRIRDMIDFFASGPGINPQYWAEKITNSTAREATRRYSEELLREQVEQAARQRAEEGDYTYDAIMAAWREHIAYREMSVEHVAHESLRDFRVDRDDHFGFGPDTWEWSLRDWDHVYLLCCFAIRAGVDAYRAQR